jgi:hypothetical protein
VWREFLFSFDNLSVSSRRSKSSESSHFGKNFSDDAKADKLRRSSRAAGREPEFVSRSVQIFGFGRTFQVFLAGLTMAMDAGESKLALPFCGGESACLFDNLRCWLDESQPVGRDRIFAGGNPCAQRTVGQETSVQ